MQYFIGTGGWAYFNVSNEPSLKAYSESFNFVEVNYTFYKYPRTSMVEQWRKTVPKDFTFSVRCNQDLTHRIGLKPVAEAYQVFDQMTTYCRILEAPFLVLETPPTYVLDGTSVKEASEFLSTVNTRDIRLVWELRSSPSEEAYKLMRDFRIVPSVDLSRETLNIQSDVVYTRLFGKGKHNVYQFTDDELVDIDHKILKSQTRTAVTSFHGLRMNTDAARFKHYKETGTFFAVTSFTGTDSARQVLSEDARFPASKAALIEDQGWKVIDVTAEKRAHLSECLDKIPDRTYNSLDEVIRELEAQEK
jgi:uncharacterized protein YecE (DUF72 family)